MIKHVPTPDECREVGGHYWRAQVPGQPNVCAECGYEGAIFEPGGVIGGGVLLGPFELTEQQVRLRALELAVDWAGQRGEHGNAHPGSAMITSVSKAFTEFITDGTVVS